MYEGEAACFKGYEEGGSEEKNCLNVMWPSCYWLQDSGFIASESWPKSNRDKLTLWFY